MDKIKTLISDLRAAIAEEFSEAKDFAEHELDHRPHHQAIIDGLLNDVELHLDHVANHAPPSK